RAAHGEPEHRVLELLIAADALEAIAARGGGLLHVEAELLGVRGEILRGKEASARLVSPRLGRALAALGGELVLDLGRDLPEGQEPALLAVDHLDGVVSERRAHGLRRALSLLQREDRLLALWLHLALAHEPEHTSLRGR